MKKQRQKISILILLVLFIGSAIAWRYFYSIKADVVSNQTISNTPATVSFFGTVSVRKNAIPLNKITVYAGNVGTTATAGGEFALYLSPSAWKINDTQYQSVIPVRFVDSDNNQVLTVENITEPFNLYFPAEWIDQYTNNNFVDSNNTIPTSDFSVRKDFVVSVQ